MKKIAILFIGLLLCGVGIRANDAISMNDKYQIGEKIKKFVQAVNDKNYKAIDTLVSNRVPDLAKKIQDRMGSLDLYVFGFSLPAIEQTPEGNAKISGKYKEAGVGWKSEGFSTYFVLKKINGDWVIIDTDFYKGFSYWTILALVFFLVGIFSFWLWMLVDCANSDNQGRVKWILLIVFLNIIGALLYFLFARRKRKE